MWCVLCICVPRSALFMHVVRGACSICVTCVLYYYMIKVYIPGMYVCVVLGSVDMIHTCVLIISSTVTPRTLAYDVCVVSSTWYVVCGVAWGGILVIGVL